jgi:ligand-binding sensor domain-containing protein
MLTAPAALASPVPVRTSAEKAHRGEREPVRHAVARAIPQESRRIDDIVYSLVSAPGGLYAGTEDGVLRSTDNGRSWTLVPSLKMPEARFVAAQKTMVLVGGLKRMSLSMDAGQSWDNIALPADLTQIASLTVDELGNLWVAGREGVFYSTDYGLNWKTLRNLYVTQADSVYFDAANHRVLATAKGTTTVFSAHLPDYKVENWDTGWNLRFVRPVGDHLVGATLFDGMVVEPRLVDSKVGAVRMTAAR